MGGVRYEFFPQADRKRPRKAGSWARGLTAASWRPRQTADRTRSARHCAGAEKLALEHPRADLGVAVGVAVLPVPVGQSEVGLAEQLSEVGLDPQEHITVPSKNCGPMCNIEWWLSTGVPIDSTNHVGLNPQELVLLYMILEIGVCFGDPAAALPSSAIPRLKPLFDGEATELETGLEPASRHPWAWLLQRAFAVDIMVCPRCRGAMRLVGIANQRDGIARVLATVVLGPRPPPRPCQS